MTSRVHEVYTYIHIYISCINTYTYIHNEWMLVLFYIQCFRVQHVFWPQGYVLPLYLLQMLVSAIWRIADAVAHQKPLLTDTAALIRGVAGKSKASFAREVRLPNVMVHAAISSVTDVNPMSPNSRQAPWSKFFKADLWKAGMLTSYCMIVLILHFVYCRFTCLFYILFIVLICNISTSSTRIIRWVTVWIGGFTVQWVTSCTRIIRWVAARTNKLHAFNWWLLGNTCLERW